MSGWLLAADNPGIVRRTVRDVDNRLNHREHRAVDEWIASGVPFHLMRDHLWHQRPILAYSFGGLRNVSPGMRGAIEAWPEKTGLRPGRGVPGRGGLAKDQGQVPAPRRL